MAGAGAMVGSLGTQLYLGGLHRPVKDLGVSQRAAGGGSLRWMVDRSGRNGGASRVMRKQRRPGSFSRSGHESRDLFGTLQISCVCVFMITCLLMLSMPSYFSRKQVLLRPKEPGDLFNRTRCTVISSIPMASHVHMTISQLPDG